MKGNQYYIAAVLVQQSQKLVFCEVYADTKAEVIKTPKHNALGNIWQLLKPSR